MDLVPSVTNCLNLDWLNILPYPTPHGLFLDLMLDGPYEYLTIIPRARMGSESIAHEAEWATDSEAMRARVIIVLVKSN